MESCFFIKFRYFVPIAIVSLLRAYLVNEDIYQNVFVLSIDIFWISEIVLLLITIVVLKTCSFLNLSLHYSFSEKII